MEQNLWPATIEAEEFALAYVPESDVTTLFDELMESTFSQKTHELKDLTNYFEDTWISIHPFCNIWLWNVYRHWTSSREYPKRNNSVKAWHHTFC